MNTYIRTLDVTEIDFEMALEIVKHIEKGTIAVEVNGIVEADEFDVPEQYSLYDFYIITDTKYLKPTSIPLEKILDKLKAR